MPNASRHYPSRGHSAGFLTFEAVITYPFHPQAGQTVLVVGDYEHSGIHHLLIRQPQGGFYQVPDWMFSPTASTLGIVVVPRLPVGQLLLLRGLVDRLLACYSTYYNGVRTHLALDKDAPFHRPAQTIGRIASVSWLGGLHHQYVGPHNR